MTISAQKTREMNFAFKLGSLMGRNWEIEFPPNETEWPDLLVFDEQKTFGLEIREITKDSETRKGSKRRAGESRNAQKTNELMEKYYERSCIPLNVSIRGRWDDEGDVLGSLLDFANKNSDWKSTKIQIGNSLQVHVTRLPSEIGRYTRWDHAGDRVGWVRKIDAEYLAPFVLEKEKKISKYKTHIKDVRLLLVADRTFISGMLEMEEGDIKMKSLFEELYFLEYPYRAHTFSS